MISNLVCNIIISDDVNLRETNNCLKVCEKENVYYFCFIVYFIQY